MNATADYGRLYAVTAEQPVDAPTQTLPVVRESRRGVWIWAGLSLAACATLAAMAVSSVSGRHPVPQPAGPAQITRFPSVAPVVLTLPVEATSAPVVAAVPVVTRTSAPRPRQTRRAAAPRGPVASASPSPTRPSEPPSASPSPSVAPTSVRLPPTQAPPSGLPVPGGT